MTNKYFSCDNVTEARCGLGEVIVDEIYWKVHVRKGEEGIGVSQLEDRTAHHGRLMQAGGRVAYNVTGPPKEHSEFRA